MSTQPNNIRALREARGWNQAQLASLLPDGDGRTPAVSTISKLETGEQQLTVEWLGRLARAFGVAPTDIVDLGAGPVLLGFCDSAQPAELPTGHPLARAASDLCSWWRVVGHVLDEIDILDGDLILVDHSQAATQAVRTGDVVVAQVPAPDGSPQATTVFRQYVFPALLITNSARGNLPAINTRESDARIMGVMVPDGHLTGRATRRA
jgi:transcriptional regulator with XRE-family HTH domain